MWPGREIQVAILAGQALPSIEIIPKEGFYDYENKYQPGAAEEVCPAPIPPAWEQRVGQAALTVYHALGLSVYSRADFIVDRGGNPLVPGDQHPAGDDPHQPGAPGGCGGGH